MKGITSKRSQLGWLSSIVNELDVDAHLGRASDHAEGIDMWQVCSWQLDARLELTENLCHDGGVSQQLSQFALQWCKKPSYLGKYFTYDRIYSKKSSSWNT